MEPIILKNHCLTVTLDPVGAVLSSILRDNLEYLWQGDAASWPRRDANLFPCVGRSYDGQYRLGSQVYPMGIHGFCQDACFTVTRQGSAFVRFTLTDSPQTRQCYPFTFAFHVEYTLKENTIIKTCRVENRGSQPMHFGLGSHPGFRVPLDGGDFTHWYLNFSGLCQPRRVCFDPSNWLLAPQRPEYPLVDDQFLPLRHGLFDQDAIVLEGTNGSVTLQSDHSPHSIRIDYPQMPYVGFWHTPQTEAPFVCVEPWLTLPAPHDHMADWQTLEGLVHLPAGEVYENTITITMD